MRILITNDDGISAPGLAVLTDIATALAGPDGEVWTVAPAFEQSGVGHCISYSRPFMIQQLAARRFAVEGSPADCVLAGLHQVLDTAPDLILSGVNRGNNSAENALYSGTLGAAIEGALQGVLSIAISQYYGPANRDLDNPFEASATHGKAVVERIIAATPSTQPGYQLFYNVNVPPVAARDVKGTRLVPQGLRPGTGFHTEATTSPTGRDYLWIKGGNQQVQTAAGTDAAVNLDGYISVTPMRADLTAHDMLDTLGAIAT
ncbi:5'/3'-nucleotidase SurE [uncultured Tateyamaria sp.]|uniref:5'/3'-nucleotidase SurE n=1 Tax=uncultured Tateyamaria sp. TaxID=455651 RepID=UPI0026026631|nr:5'/3'-nucleotidase SurE [uncultured Tateyamaria sp.]